MVVPVSAAVSSTVAEVLLASSTILEEPASDASSGTPPLFPSDEVSPSVCVVAVSSVTESDDAPAASPVCSVIVEAVVAACSVVMAAVAAPACPAAAEAADDAVSAATALCCWLSAVLFAVSAARAGLVQSRTVESPKARLVRYAASRFGEYAMCFG